MCNIAATTERRREFFISKLIIQMKRTNQLNSVETINVNNIFGWNFRV